MNDQIPWDLILKDLNGECSKSETDDINNWIKYSTDNQNIYLEQKALWTLTRKINIPVKPNAQKAWIKINEKLNTSGADKKISWLSFTFNNLSRIAAIFFAIGLIISAIYYFSNRPKEISKQLVYKEIVTSKGQKSQVILPDGSTVWINSGSKIRYEENFSTENREVFLEGEAFFNVIKNANKPFVVKTLDGIDIKVLGTTFNVRSYPEDEIIEATLVTGNIAIDKKKDNEKIYMSPNNKATISKLDKSIKIEAVNTEIFTAWKEDKLVFNNESMGPLLKKLERWYDVKIVLKNDKELKKYRYTATFQNETIRHVLELLKISAPIEFKIENNKTIVISEDSLRSESLHELK